MKNDEKEIELVKGSMGTASLVCGIISFFIFPGILSILAIIFGAIGMNRNEKYAKTGVILGIITLTFMLMVIILFTAIFFSALTAVF